MLTQSRLNSNRLLRGRREYWTMFSENFKKECFAVHFIKIMFHSTFIVPLQFQKPKLRPFSNFVRICLVKVYEPEYELYEG